MPSPGKLSEVILEADVPVVECRACGAHGPVDVGFALPGRGYTKSFAEMAAWHLNGMSISDFARMYSLDRETTRMIFLDWVGEAVKGTDLDRLKRIGITEANVGGDDAYVTLVVDLDNGNPVFAGEGKAGTALAQLWDRLGKARASRIRCVAMDMAGDCLEAVAKRLPKAEIVFDHDHVISLARRYSEDLLREVFAKVKAEDGRAYTSGDYILFRDGDGRGGEGRDRVGRDRDRDPKECQEHVRSVNRPLIEMDILRDALSHVLDIDSRAEAEPELDGWCRMTAESDSRLVKELGETVSRFREGILAYYVHLVPPDKVRKPNSRARNFGIRPKGYKNKKLYKLIFGALKELDGSAEEDG
jgi:transposase